MLTPPEPQTPLDNSGNEPPSNRSDNPHLHELLGRRRFLQGALGVAIGGFLDVKMAMSAPATGGQASSNGLIHFSEISASRADEVRVPPGYTATPFVPWGTPLHVNGPALRPDAANSGADQEVQVGSHHDGMHFFPLGAAEMSAKLKHSAVDKTTVSHGRLEQGRAEEGLLVVNHEYIDPNILHPLGPTLAALRPTDEVRKEIAAHGVSVLHIRQDKNGAWQLVEGSGYNRRITAATPMEIRGPARGSAKLRTRYSSDGTLARGTLNNCSHGVTPWGTYLVAEENWAGYFANRDAVPPREHSRYGVTRVSRYRWESAASQEDVYTRFDASSHAAEAPGDFRHEPNHFGWVVEIDPFNPTSVPQKRTALGRFAREGIVFAPVQEGRPLVCYSGDDTKNEYLYKFVSAENYQAASAGGHLLDAGTLFVARFAEDGNGEWIPLDWADADLRKKAGRAGTEFTDQADLLINTRLAADIAGATKMDRPEWGAVDPRSGQVYFSLTNNSDRTTKGIDAANPRAFNVHGHIIRWTPRHGDHAERNFTWDIFVLAGPAETKAPAAAVPLTPHNQFSCPDGLWFDPRGVLWIQTDMSGDLLTRGPFGNNQMLAADPQTGEIRRFLTGPVDCEVTGVVMTPDMRTLFVNIQHPGESTAPGRFTSHWPDGGKHRPRSATVVIRKNDGGIIGT